MKKTTLNYLYPFLILFLFLPQTTFAQTSCPPFTPEEAAEHATAIFSGEVVDVVTESSGRKFAPVPTFPFIQLVQPLETIKITFAVDTVWHGEPYTEYIVRTWEHPPGLGYLPVGDTYLVYAYGNPDHLVADMCLRTQPLADATEDLSHLGTGTTPTIIGNNQENNSPSIAYFIPLACFTISIVSSVIIILWRRKYY